MRGIFVWLEYRSAIERAEEETQDLAMLLEECTKRTLDANGEFGGVAQAALRLTFLQNVSRPNAKVDGVILGIRARMAVS
jgi:hypothetical protein